jgi:hypothetical protein
MMKLALLLSLLALGALGLTGCGGGDDDEETPPAPTRQEFVAQADAICESAEQDFEAALSVHGLPPPPTREEEAEFLEQEVIPLYLRRIDGIQELTPPPGDEEEIEAVLSAAERTLADDLRERPDRVAKGWLEFTRRFQFQRYGSGPCAD